MGRDDADVIEMSREIRDEHGYRERLLQEKCKWEHLSRYAVLRRYGDPGSWQAVSTRSDVGEMKRSS